MFSQFFASVFAPLRLGRRSLPLLLGTVGAISPWAGQPSAFAQIPGFTRPVSTKAEVLKTYPRSTKAADLGSPLATNYPTFCGQVGTPTETIIATEDRLMCSTGSDLPTDPIPVSVTTPEPTWHNSPLQEPMVLQQYDRTQLFSFPR